MCAHTNLHKNEQSEQDQIISYKTLRILMGLAGIFLPLLVVLAKWISEKNSTLEFSISDYYDNSSGGDMLVGVLFALGFSFSYKGPEAVDNRIADVGSAMAIGVALFPTTSKVLWIHYAHFIFAIGLFTVFIIFSTYLFRKTKKYKPPTPEKLKRNKLYLVCGIIMIVCIAGLALAMWLFEDACKKYNLVFWGEALALVSFGISWLTKAEWLYWKDKEPETHGE